MAINIPALPAKDSTDWYAHYTGVDAGARELQGLLSAVTSAQAIAGFAAMNQPPDGAVTALAPAASTTYIFKLHSAQTLSVTTVGLLTGGTAAATPSGFYVALYDITGTLFPGSGSADISSQLTSSSVYVGAALGATITVPAGVFYVALRMGTAGTLPQLRGVASPPPAITNAGLTATPGLQSFRASVGSNAWSGATPPSTFGTLSASNINIFAAVK